MIDDAQTRLLIEFGIPWASLVRVSFHARDGCDAQMGVEKNGLILSFITEVSWMRKNGHARYNSYSRAHGRSRKKEDRIAMVMNITYMHAALETFPEKVG
jgi:hypothetical protein